MKATITVDMDNDAFDRRPATELVRILKELLPRIKEGADYVALMDENGNKVGEFNVEK